MIEAYEKGCKDSAAAFRRFQLNDLVLNSMGKYVPLVDMARRRNEQLQSTVSRQREFARSYFLFRLGWGEFSLVCPACIRVHPCASVCICVGARARVCMCVCACTCACVCLRVCV